MLADPALFVLGSFVVACSATVDRLPRAGESLRAQAFLVEPGGKGLNLAVARGASAPRSTASWRSATIPWRRSPRRPSTAPACPPRCCIASPARPSRASASPTPRARIASPSTRAPMPGSGPRRCGRRRSGSPERPRPGAVRGRRRGGGGGLPDRPRGRACAPCSTPRRSGCRRPGSWPTPRSWSSMRSRRRRSAVALGVPLPDVRETNEPGGLGRPRGGAPRLRAGPRRRHPRVRRRARASGTAGPPWSSPPSRVTAIDTLGAGDAFTAGLAVALAEGRPLPESLSLAAACGACVVRRKGVFDALPDRAAIADLVGGVA